MNKKKCLRLFVTVKSAMTSCWNAFLFPVLLSACTGIYSLVIDVQEPAAVTFPSDVAEVLIVNNTVPQPGNIGITRIYGEKEVEEPEISLDSVSWLVTESLTSHINRAHFFDKVFRYLKPIRDDGEWIARIPLSEEFREEVFKTQNTNAIISIDRILFAVKQLVRDDDPLFNKKHSEQENAQLPLSVFVDVNATVNCSIYLRGENSPLSSFALSDSLSYRISFNADRVTVFKDLLETLIDDLSKVIGEKLAYNIVPSWTTKERFFYTGANSRMQEGFSFTKSGKWATAESIWVKEYSTRSRKSDKARIANNIAIANEMQDQWEGAIYWAQKAKEEFTNAGFSDKSEEITLITDYIVDLQNRIQNNQLLDVQWGGEYP